MLKKPLYTVDNIQIFGNNQEREVLYFFQLSEKWQAIAKKDFNWIEDSSTCTWDDMQFFIYKNQLYCMEDFMSIRNGAHPTPNFMKNFDGYTNDTYFSGILIKYSEEDSDYIKVYTYYVS